MTCIRILYEHVRIGLHHRGHVPIKGSGRQELLLVHNRMRKVSPRGAAQPHLLIDVVTVVNVLARQCWAEQHTSLLCVRLLRTGRAA